MAKYEKVTWEMVAAAQRKEPGAVAAVVTAMKGFVEFWVRKLRPRNDAEADDLRQEAMLGVMRAIETFKPHPAKGTTHVHFAGWSAFWIRAFAGRRRWTGGTKKYKDASDDALSIDLPLYSDDGENSISLGEALSDENAEPLEERTDWSLKRAMVKSAASRLEQRQQIAWSMRFERQKTLSEIGEFLGYSREYVRQLLYNPRTGAVVRITRHIVAMQKAADGTLDESIVQDLPDVRQSHELGTRLAQKSRQVLRAVTNDRHDEEEGKGESEISRGCPRLRITRRAREDSTSPEVELRVG